MNGPNLPLPFAAVHGLQRTSSRTNPGWACHFSKVQLQQHPLQKGFLETREMTPDQRISAVFQLPSSVN